MARKGRGSPTTQGRVPDQLDAILDRAWELLQQWQKEPNTRAHDIARPQERRDTVSSEKETTASLKLLARLFVGPQRDLIYQELGLRPRTNQAIQEIADRIGEERWNHLAAIFAELPIDYRNHVRRPRELLSGKSRLAKQCRKLANLVEMNSPERYTDFLKSPFRGILAKQVFTIYWYWALSSLRDSKNTIQEATKIAEQCLTGLYLPDPSRPIARMLRDYADALDGWKPEGREAALLTLAKGKLNEKEFVKRAVFALLSTELRSLGVTRRNPNKEIAAIVNTILGLRGSKSVKANNITQMNKMNRRKYYKEVYTFAAQKLESEHS